MASVRSQSQVFHAHTSTRGSMSKSMHMETETASCALEPRKELKMGSTILDCFTKLVKDNERERLDGGIALLRHMSQKKAVSFLFPFAFSFVLNLRILINFYLT